MYLTVKPSLGRSKAVFCGTVTRETPQDYEKRHSFSQRAVFYCLRGREGRGRTGVHTHQPAVKPGPERVNAPTETRTPCFCHTDTLSREQSLELSRSHSEARRRAGRTGSSRSTGWDHDIHNLNTEQKVKDLVQPSISH